MDGSEIVLDKTISIGSTQADAEEKAQSVYVLNGIKGFTIKSDEYTMKFISPLDGAKIVNYANNAETPFKIVGSEGTFNAYATPENKKNGVSLYINAKYHTLTLLQVLLL